MNPKVNKIQIQFNKASCSYDSVAKIQRKSAKFLVSKIFENYNFHPKNILDLGAGTGYVTELLLSRCKQCSFYLNDIADQMLEVCKIKFSKYNNFYYLSGDLLNLNDDMYDGVISNLVLQWIDDLGSALKFINSKSYKVCAFSTLLDGTFKEWEHILSKYQPIQLLKYPKLEKVIKLCNNIKRSNQFFQYWLIDLPSSFPNPLAFMRYLKLLGASSSSDSMHFSNIKKLIKFQNSTVTVTYKIFFGIFKKLEK